MDIIYESTMKYLFEYQKELKTKIKEKESVCKKILDMQYKKYRYIADSDIERNIYIAVYLEPITMIEAIGINYRNYFIVRIPGNVYILDIEKTNVVETVNSIKIAKMYIDDIYRRNMKYMF